VGGAHELTEEESARRQALEAAGLLHPDPAAVSAPRFAGSDRFFLADDKVQVKYEMLRAHAVDGLSATAAARAHGYSRAAFYLAAAAFEAAGVAGLLDERRGRKGPVKLTAEILAFLHAGEGRSGARLAAEVEARFGVRLHRRTLERVRRGTPAASARSRSTAGR
jgi:transposase